MELTRCPRCEFNPTRPGDYLCEFCRTGTVSEDAESYQKFSDKHPEIANFLSRVAFGEVRVGDADEFLSDLRRKAVRFGELSERQLMAAQKFLDNDNRRSAEAMELEPIPEEGRMQISGTVLSVKVRYSNFGETLKMVVLDDRKFKVWGTVPAKLGVPEKGDHVTFTATVKVSDDDSSFGFYSRPAGATLRKGNA